LLETPNILLVSIKPINHIIMTEKMLKIAVVGALTIDITPDGLRRLGGPPWYAGSAVKALSAQAAIHTAVGDDFPKEFEEKVFKKSLKAEGYLRIRSAKTFCFIHHLDSKGRRLKLLNRGPDIPLTSIEILDADAALVSPVFHEINQSHLEIVRKNAGVLAVDAQGFLRCADDDGFIMLKPASFNLFFRRADIIHFSEEEVMALFRVGNVLDAVETLGKAFNGTALVGVVDGVYVVSHGMITLVKHVYHEITEDTTGAGDILAGAFIKFYCDGYDVYESASLALEVVRTALRKPPPDRLPEKIAIEDSKTFIDFRRSVY